MGDRRTAGDERGDVRILPGDVDELDEVERGASHGTDDDRFGRYGLEYPTAGHMQAICGCQHTDADIAFRIDGDRSDLRGWRYRIKSEDARTMNDRL